jgi:hypothetical protein
MLVVVSAAAMVTSRVSERRNAQLVLLVRVGGAMSHLLDAISSERLPQAARLHRLAGPRSGPAPAGPAARAADRARRRRPRSAA